MARTRRNRDAFERTLAVLRKLGRVEPQDAALVAVGRTLAEKMDVGDDSPSQATWAYLGVLRQLRGEVNPSGPNDDDLAAFLDILRTQMGDAPQS